MKTGGMDKLTRKWFFTLIPLTYAAIAAAPLTLIPESIKRTHCITNLFVLVIKFLFYFILFYSSNFF